MTDLPLYDEARSQAPETWKKYSNAGLWHQKFFDRWETYDPHADRLIPTEGKRKWLDQFHEKFVGNRELLDEHLRRRALRWRAFEDRGVRVGRFETRWRMVTGTGYQHPVENGFTWHHSLGVPFLPGSGIKGMVRSWAKEWCEVDEEIVLRIFGSSSKEGGPSVGSVIFFDALPVGAVKLEVDVMTPHYGAWYRAEDPNEAETAPADWHAPTPIPFLTVAPGQPFVFALQARTLEHLEDARIAWDWLCDALPGIGAGAKTATGYGYFDWVGEGTGLTHEEIVQGLSEAEAVSKVVAFIKLQGAGESLSEEDEELKTEIVERFVPRWIEGKTTLENLSDDKLLSYVEAIAPEQLVDEEEEAILERKELQELEEKSDFEGGEVDKGALHKACKTALKAKKEDDGWSEAEIEWLTDKLDIYTSSVRRLKKKDKKWIKAFRDEFDS